MKACYEVRAVEAAKKDQLKARHRLGKEFLLRHGQRPESLKAWTKQYLEWISWDLTGSLHIRK